MENHPKSTALSGVSATSRSWTNSGTGSQILRVGTAMLMTTVKQVALRE
jgi:hypothetical protein